MAENNGHVFDALWARQSTPDTRPRVPRVAPSRASAVAHARAYKATRDFDRTPHAPSTSPEHQITGVAPCTACPRPPEPLPP